MKLFAIVRSNYTRWRPYRSEYTTTLQNCAVNHYRARIVLRWGTAREVLRVLLALFVPAACRRAGFLLGIGGSGGATLLYVDIRAGLR